MRVDIFFSVRAQIPGVPQNTGREKYSVCRKGRFSVFLQEWDRPGWYAVTICCPSYVLRVTHRCLYVVISLLANVDTVLESCDKDSIVKIGSLFTTYRDGIPDILVRVHWRSVVEQIVSILTDLQELCGYGESSPNRWRLELRDNEATVTYKLVWWCVCTEKAQLHNTITCCCAL